MEHGTHAARPGVGRGLVAGGLILAAAAALRLLSPGYVNPDLARRLLGVLLGAVVLMYANAIPKALTPLVQMRCDAAAEQRLRRFAGWMLALGGLGYAVAWAILPLAYAANVAVGILGLAFLLVAGRLALAMSRRRCPG